MINTVIFDFDGTLADTNELIINSFKHIYTYYNQAWDEDYIRSTFGEPLRLVISRDFSEYDVDVVIERYRKYQVHRFENEVFLYDTVEETLEYLHKNGIKMGIATSRSKDSAVKALKKFGINHYFQSIVAVEDVQNHKPNKEPLVKCMKELNSEFDQTLYVGDSKFDIECAINAGVVPVLVGWQSNSQELATTYEVKHVLHNMRDLLGLVEIV